MDSTPFLILTVAVNLPATPLILQHQKCGFVTRLHRPLDYWQPAGTLLPLLTGYARSPLWLPAPLLPAVMPATRLYLRERGSRSDLARISLYRRWSGAQRRGSHSLVCTWGDSPFSGGSLISSPTRRQAASILLPRLVTLHRPCDDPC